MPILSLFESGKPLSTKEERKLWIIYALLEMDIKPDRLGLSVDKHA